MADNANLYGSQQSKRQAAILDRFLPEGYSAEAEVSLSTEPTQEPVDDSGRSSPSPFQTIVPDSTSDICGHPHDGGAALAEVLESSLRLQGGDIHRDMLELIHFAVQPRSPINLHLACNLPMNSHIQSNGNLEASGVNTCKIVPVSDASVARWLPETSLTFLIFTAALPARISKMQIHLTTAQPLMTGLTSQSVALC
ncbi:hypothetical protein CP533_4431 [Ophiocordyceps camponoti-saundersi (nom. inval.)]|nr:hypothetical protein CP533_4431 [Ophiocordyceps camponoti-saundersi (nom. inval.)]